jgi:hypothetical protein
MLPVEGGAETERASRYLVQFCKHAAAMRSPRGHQHLRGILARQELQVHADWSHTHGAVTFTPWGQCTLTAGADTLTLRVEATDEDNLRKIQDIITRNLARFGRRDGVAVNWQPAHPPETPAAALPDSAHTDGGSTRDENEPR